MTHRPGRVLTALLIAVMISIPAVAITPVRGETSFIFTASGDYGNTLATNNTLSGIAASGASFNLALGDLGYLRAWKPVAASPNGGEEKWCNIVKSRVGDTFPFQLVVGNHEDSTTDLDGFIGDYAACLPDRISNQPYDGHNGYSKQYYFDYPTAAPLVRVITIAAGESVSGSGKYTYTVGSQDYLWLSQAVDDAKAAGLWVIVGMHKPCLSIGKMDCSSFGPDLLNLLLSKRVDLILQGHDHEYQRFKQLTCGSPTSFTPSCVADDGSDGRYDRGEGSVIVIAGLPGGGELGDINLSDPDLPYVAAWMGKNSNFPSCSCSGGRGFVKYTVSASAIKGEFVGVVSSSSGFKTRYSDSFTIGPPPTPPPLTTSFTFSPAFPTATTTISFTASASGGNPPYTFGWGFGDGATATGNPVSHVYSAAGAYTVTLTVVDASSATVTTSQNVTVSSSDQQMTLVLRPTGPGSSSQWSTSASCAAANWGCVDDGPSELPYSDATHVLASSNGMTDLYDFVSVSSLVSASTTIQSVKVSVVARMSSTTATVVIAIDIKVGSASPIVVNQPNLKSTYQTYNETWNTSPFSGQPWTVSELDTLQTGQTLVSTPGTTARVTAVFVEIITGGAPSPPQLTSSFTYSPAFPTTTTLIEFTATSTGGTPPYSFSWNFGDGTTGTGGSVTHMYLLQGTYTVTLTTTDSNTQAIVSQNITVTQAAQTATLLLLPVGSGSQTQWLPTTSCSGGNWDCVNDGPAHDGDSTFVRASASAIDYYDLPTVSSLVPSGSLIVSVKVSIVARKSATSEAVIAVLLKDGQTSASGNLITLSTTYTTYEQTWLGSPFTSAAWTVSELDFLQVGQTYLVGPASSRVTSIFVEVQYVTT